MSHALCVSRLREVLRLSSDISVSVCLHLSLSGVSASLWCLYLSLLYLCLCVSFFASVSVFVSIAVRCLCVCTVRIITSPLCLWLLWKENPCQGGGLREGGRPALTWRGFFPGQHWRLWAGGKRHSAQGGWGLAGRPFLGRDCLLLSPTAGWLSSLTPLGWTLPGFLGPSAWGKAPASCPPGNHPVPWGSVGGREVEGWLPHSSATSVLPGLSPPP